MDRRAEPTRIRRLIGFWAGRNCHCSYLRLRQTPSLISPTLSARSIPTPPNGIPRRLRLQRRGRPFRRTINQRRSGPAALFWAATAYSITAGMMTAAPTQLMRSISRFSKVTDKHGPLDRSPVRAAEAGECSRVQTGSRPPTAATSSSPFASMALASSSTIRAGGRTTW